MAVRLIVVALVLLMAPAAFGQCVNWAIIDWSGGANGDLLTIAKLQASTYGISAPAWTEFGTAGAIPATFSGAGPIAPAIAANHVVGGAMPTLCTNPWPGDAATPLGRNGYNSSLTADYWRWIFPSYPTTMNATAVTVSYWFYTDYANTDIFNFDVVTLYNLDGARIYTKFINSQFFSNGATMRMGLEGTSTGCTGHNGGTGAIAISGSTWYNIQLRWSMDLTGVVNDSIWIYNEGTNHTRGTLVGQINWDGSSCNGVQPNQLQVGPRNNNGSGTLNHNTALGDIRVCWYITDNCTAFPFDPYNPLTVETAADGSGSAIGNTNVPSGTTLSLYSIHRLASDSSFVDNGTCTWSLTNRTGGVINTDMVVAGNSKSAAFTGHLLGSATVASYDANNVPIVSGTLTVTGGSPPASTTVETRADGAGAVLGATGIGLNGTVTAYSISRDAIGNFLSNVAATWSLTSKTGGVANGDLVAAGDNKSATMTGHIAGSGVMTALANTFTGNSGTITVTAPGGAGSGLMRAHGR